MTTEEITHSDIDGVDIEQFLDIRSYTEKLAEPLSPEDQCIQSMPDVSPTKWHRAHTTWFFETFILCVHKPDYKVFDPDFGFLFNSYYEAVGPRHNRPERGLITRPTAQEIAEYRKYVDGQMAEFLSDILEKGDSESISEITYLTILGMHHEQQHQELILSDIKEVLFANPKLPAYLPEGIWKDDFQQPEQQWESYAGGEVMVGSDFRCAEAENENCTFETFTFDNETPSHSVLLNDFELSNRLVTVGDWLEFIADGGYNESTLWLSDGWYAVQEESWNAPRYFIQIDGEWKIFTLGGLKSVDECGGKDTPVTHISYYEADAFARWAGARLPTEFEWEHSAIESGRSLPSAVWEWTASPYSPYPGFAPAKGAVGEYNGKFMVNQMVLRGGCRATPPNHIRPTYRNFYPPKTRWHFSGLRLAK